MMHMECGKPARFCVTEARKVQAALSRKVVLADDFGTLRRIAGVDAGYSRRKGIIRAAVAVLGYPGLELLESVVIELPEVVPYLPGYLSFREVPAALVALGRLKARPDLVVCDGQGIAHPRRFGLASHLGVVAELPAIGVAKSRLVGSFDEPGMERGDCSPLTHEGETVGMVLRTRRGVKPVFVSPGHRVSLETAVALTLELCPKYRLPETTRAAHRLASG